MSQRQGLVKTTDVLLNASRTEIPLRDKSREYIVYCQTSQRSAAAALLAGGLCALNGLEDKERG